MYVLIRVAKAGALRQCLSWLLLLPVPRTRQLGRGAASQYGAAYGTLEGRRCGGMQEQQSALQPVRHSGSSYYQGGYKEYMSRCQSLAMYVKRLLWVHTICHKEEYWWEFVVCLQSSILHLKNTKLAKFVIFRLLDIA